MFNSNTFSALWWISAAHSAWLAGDDSQVDSHEVNNSKPRLCYGEDGSVISFLATLKFFNSSLAFSAPFSLSGGFSEHTQRGSRGYLLMGIDSRASSIVDSLFLQDLHDYDAEQESTRKLAILDST